MVQHTDIHWELYVKYAKIVLFSKSLYVLFLQMVVYCSFGLSYSFKHPCCFFMFTNFFKIQRPSNTNLFCFLPSMCSSFWQVLVLEPWFKWNRTRTNEENEHGGRGAGASTDQTNLQHNGGGAGIHECGFKAPVVFFVCRVVSGIMFSPIPFATPFAIPFCNSELPIVCCEWMFLLMLAV